MGVLGVLGAVYVGFPGYDGGCRAFMRILVSGVSCRDWREYVVGRKVKVNEDGSRRAGPGPEPEPGGEGSASGKTGMKDGGGGGRPIMGAYSGVVVRTGLSIISLSSTLS